MTTILLLYAATWLALTSFAYLMDNNLVRYNAIGLFAAGWVALILSFIGMAGR